MAAKKRQGTKTKKPEIIIQEQEQVKRDVEFDGEDDSSPTYKFEEDGLIPRESRFVQRLLIHNNQSKAARESGYSAANAAQAAHRLLNDTPRVIAVVARERKKIADRFDVSRESLIRELSYLSNSRLRNFFDESGNSLLPMSEISDEDGAALQGVEVIDRPGSARLKKIKLGDKRGAIETLAKIQGYMKEDVSERKDRLQEMVDALKKQS